MVYLLEFLLRQTLKWPEVAIEMNAKAPAAPAP